MNRPLTTLVGAMILALAVACGSDDDGGDVAVARTADLSQFPTPSRSLAAPQYETTSPAQAAQSQPQAERDDSGGTAESAPITREELQQLRQRLLSGELSEEEAQQALQRLRAQGGGFGVDGGSQVVGTIETIEQGTITVATEVALVTVSVQEGTDIRITSVIEPAALTVGTQVMVVSERVESNTVARAITIIPDDQSGFGPGRPGLGAGQGRGGFGVDQVGLGPLFGTVADVFDKGFTLETQRGPLPIVVNEESVVVQTRQGTPADLEPGMLVRVVGPADENDNIEAQSIIVTPEGLEDIRGFGGGT